MLILGLLNPVSGPLLDLLDIGLSWGFSSITNDNLLSGKLSTSILLIFSSSRYSFTNINTRLSLVLLTNVAILKYCVKHNMAIKTSSPTPLIPSFPLQKNENTKATIQRAIVKISQNEGPTITIRRIASKSTIEFIATSIM